MSTKNKQTQLENRKLICSKCLVVTNHEVLFRVEENWGNEDIQGTDRYEIVKCRGCGTHSFCNTISCSDDVDYDHDTGKYYHPERIRMYPRRLKDRRELKDTYLIPMEIRSVYKETHEALCNQIPRLASVGMRIIVDLVCAHLEAKGRTLEAKINDLSIKGKITKDNAEVLHATRLFGNLSAHKKQIKAGDNQLTIAMSIVEVLLMNVFIIPTKAKELNKN